MSAFLLDNAKNLQKMALFSGSTLSLLAQRPGFEPGVHRCTQPFQDCTIDHSDISAYNMLN